MTTFKVGQRVRIADGAGPHPHCGKETIITQLDVMSDPRWGTYHEVDLPPTDGRSRTFAVAAQFLAPLTDPRCADFVADMERYAKVVKPLVAA